MPYVSYGPVFILHFLDKANPEIRNTHGKSIVKAESAFRKPGGKTRHAADIFCNSQCVITNIVNKPVGKGQVSEGVFVHTVIKITVIGSKSRSQSMVMIEHAGNAI